MHLQLEKHPEHSTEPTFRTTKCCIPAGIQFDTYDVSPCTFSCMLSVRPLIKAKLSLQLGAEEVEVQMDQNVCFRICPSTPKPAELNNHCGIQEIRHIWRPLILSILLFNRPLLQEVMLSWQHENIVTEVVKTINSSHKVSFPISPQHKYPQILMYYNCLHKVLQLHQLTEIKRNKNYFHLCTWGLCESTF